MTSLKLIDLINSKKKIPEKLLTPHHKKTFSLKTRILTSIWIDQSIVFFIFSLFKILTIKSFQFYLSDTFLKVQDNYNNVFHYTLLSVLYLAYSYFCFTLNQGQTIGMKIRKIRIDLSLKNSFKKTFLFSTQYLFAGTSFGLWTLNNNFKNLFVEDDHLYHSLMEYKDDHSFKITENLQNKKSNENDFSKKAA